MREEAVALVEGVALLLLRLLHIVQSGAVRGIAANKYGPVLLFPLHHADRKVDALVQIFPQIIFSKL